MTKLPDNLLSHRASWLVCMEKLVQIAHDLDSEDTAYYEHELIAMKDMYNDLDQQELRK